MDRLWAARRAWQGFVWALGCVLGTPVFALPRDTGGDGNSVKWAVRLEAGSSVEALAGRVGASGWRPVGSLPDTYVLIFDSAEERFAGASDGASEMGERIAANPDVQWEEKQVNRIRVTRAAPDTEPLFPEQWHLRNSGQWGGVPRVDVNVEGVWAAGYTGAGVGVSVVDTGTQFTHPDLSPNYEKGYDQRDNDSDASPGGADENHGTAVAGIILAAANDRDGVGIAPGAGLYPMRLLRDGEGIPDSDEADALSRWPEEIFVSNNSWGPSDDEGVSLSPVGSLVKSTFENAENARGGKGTIYVWAAGNGRSLGQRADYDGYNTAIQSISVAAIGQDGQVTDFSEPGACVFIAAPSWGAGRGILTTDRVGADGYESDGDMTESFSGTSAAAPMVSGVVALILEANPALGWRDVQHILARTAVRTDWDDAGWFENAAGFYLNEDYGFGRVDALGAVRLAERWTPLPAAITRTEDTSSAIAIPDNGTASRVLNVVGGITVEHVEVTLNLSHSLWKQLEIALVSPSGTRSVLSRPFDTQNTGFSNYTFTTVQMWGEEGRGSWRIEVTDTVPGTTGTLRAVSLRVHGIPEDMPEAPGIHTSALQVDTWPWVLDPADWVGNSPGDALELISVVPLERGTVRFVDQDWLFEPPVDAFGRFPLSVCVRTAGGEARSFLLELERPSLSTDGVASAVLAGPVSTADVVRSPARGALSDNGFGVTYLPEEVFAAFEGVDRFSLDLIDPTAEVSIPVFFQRDWSFETDGRDAHIDLGLEGRALNQRFTIEAWVRADGWGEAATGFGRVFDKDNFLIFLNAYHHQNYSDESIVVYGDFASGSPAVFNTSSGTMVLKEWIHLAVTFDYLRSPQVEVFVNGTELPTTSPSDLLPPAVGTALFSSLGTPAIVGDNADGARGFRGGFRDMRVWSRVRTVEEIGDAAEGAAPDDPGDLLVRLRATQPGAGSATLEGILAETAFFNGLGWASARSPWASWRTAWPAFSDLGGGWSSVPHLGSVFGDYFPWVYHAHLGWVWTRMEDGEASEWFYRQGAEPGWLYWTSESLPWMFSASRDTWLYYIADSTWFYDANLGQWLRLP